ncbi:MAG: SDR family NAD(P)-dependent oxidoreductase [Mycoplasmatota bacterium]|nr:SDR family NAD(P)-dependent oxidoreductase [Mycoplasmatota bacterium]
MKSILIIGGSSDIGISLGQKLKNNGNNVILSYYKNPITITGINSYKCDVTSEKSIEEIIKYGIDLYKKIDVIINLQSISCDNSFLNKTKKEFMDVLEVNLVGTFLLNQIYSRYIDDGMIINMSSTDGIDTYSEYSLDYSISKNGIIFMSKALESYTTNKIYCLCPNWIDTSSTRQMNQEYLSNELKRINQSRLLQISEVVDVIIDIINNNIKEKLIRIDVRNDKLWIEKM